MNESSVDDRAPNESLPDSSSAQSSEVPFEQQPDLSPSPSPRPSPNPSPTPIVPDSIPEPTGENLGDHSFNDTSLSGNEDAMTLQNVYDLCISLCKQVSDQAKEIELLKAKIKRLKKKATPVIKHFKAYQKRISKEQRQQRKSSSKKQRVQKESVSKQGRKNAKGDGKAKEHAKSEGRTRKMMDEYKEIDEIGLSTEDGVSTAKERVSTDFEKVSTDKPKLSTDDLKVSTDEQMESNDDQVDASEEIFEGTEDQREGTEEKVESTAEQKESTEEQTKEEFATQASQTSTQTPTSMIFGDDETIATLLINMSKVKAISKEKEKGVELKDVEDTDRPRPTSTRSTLTLKPLPKIDPKDKGKKKIEEEDETESEDDDIPQAVKKFKQLESDEELARKVQEDWEAEEERKRNLKDVKDTDRPRPTSTKSTLTLKPLPKIDPKDKGKKKIEEEDETESEDDDIPQDERNKIAEEQATNEALIKDFDDIKARIEADRILAEKLQEQDRGAVTIEERAKEVIKEDTKEEVKDEDKDEDSTRKRKLGTRKKMKSRKRRYIQHTSEDDTDKENDELRLCLKIAQDEEKEVDYEILDRKYPIIDWKTECLGTKTINPMKEDLNAVYQLVMNKYQDQMAEGFERVLWGDLMVLFNPGVHTLMTNEGVVIHMLTEKKYPLKKEILVQMLNLRLESEEESTMALELIRFIKKNKELSIPEQTATGKGTSNPLMADVAELLKSQGCCYKRIDCTSLRNHEECLDTSSMQSKKLKEQSSS
ncbi:hypothetical protein Tco_0769334 [Tanacetum coccineum]|uniref:Uncharacterized protein n=1 Tax=Tanacetum coccineum TaxID=301880 RepID=A0ABQ4Z965_9ASTR